MVKPVITISLVCLVVFALSVSSNAYPATEPLRIEPTQKEDMITLSPIEVPGGWTEDNTSTNGSPESSQSDSYEPTSSSDENSESTESGQDDSSKF